jgi:hypothetical protein
MKNVLFTVNVHFSVIYGMYKVKLEPGGSVSIVCNCGLDDQTIEVRSPAAGAKDFFSSLCVQTDSGAHRASCSMGTGGPFPGA